MRGPLDSADTVDVGAATGRGVLVATIPGTTDGGVADHAIELMIDLAHGISRHDRAMRRGEWQPQCGVDMWHATLGIVAQSDFVTLHLPATPETEPMTAALAVEVVLKVVRGEQPVQLLNPEAWDEQRPA